MEFLTLLIALGLLQLWGSGGPFQQDSWFHKSTKTCLKIVDYPPLRLLLAVGLPCLLLVILLSLVHSWLFGLFSLCIFVAVLLFSLGRGDFSENLRSYLSSWTHGNLEAAYQKAQSIGDFKQGDNCEDYVALHEHMRKAYLYEGFERWFAVIFWFLLLGPVGALGYRLSYMSARSDEFGDDEKQLALRFVHYLDWIPARLLSLTFSLTGNFVGGFNQCWQSVWDNQPVGELIEQSALAAISSSSEKSVYPEDKEHFIEYAREELLALQGLISRSVICWLAIIAVLVLFSV
jgi:AmpE protein